MGNANSLCDFCCCCKSHDVAAQQPVTDPVMAGRPPPAPEASAEAGKPLTSTSATGTCKEMGSTSASAVADEAYQNIHDISKHGVDGDLTALISYACSLLDYAKGSQSSSSQNAKPQRKEWKFVDTTDLGKFKDLFSETADAANSLISNDQTATVMDVTKTVLKGIGKAHWVAAGLVAVAFVLERFDKVSENKAECVDLLDEMYRLARYLQILKQRRSHKEHIASLMEDALRLVVEGAAVCFFQAKSSWWYKVFGANVERRHLGDVRHRLEKIHRHLMFEVILRAYNTNQPLQLPRMEFYPHQAVIKQEMLKTIADMLELESEKKVVVVILYGLGGIGKSTLAHAVYAMVDDVLGFKFSKAELYQNTAGKPNTLAVQRKILAAISEGEVKEEPSSSLDGQKLLLKYFEKEPCFVYIDNVLDGVELSKLLPSDLEQSTKLRLVLTARDAIVRNGVDVRRREDVKLFNVESLEEKDAETLLEKQMGSDVAAQIKEEDWQYLLRICGGIPLLIEMVGKYVRYENNAAEALKEIRDERKRDHGQRFGGQSMEFFSFAFDTLEQSYRDAFLDICVFCLALSCSGWTWLFLEQTFGKDIMGVLQRRALVKKTPLEYTTGVTLDDDFNVQAKVHDVVLDMGRRRGQSNRITTVSQFRSILESTDPRNLRNIKGIYLQENREEDEEKLILPSHKLDLMSASLRILSTDYFEPHRSYNVIEIEGECKDAFPSLVFWYSLSSQSQPPFVYGKQCPELRSLHYAPASTVPLQQLPSNLKRLSLDFDHESLIKEESQKLVIDMPLSVMSNIEDFAVAGEHLREIAAGLISHMESLVQLTLCDARKLVQVPDELHTLPRLESIWFDDVALRELPENIGGCVLLKRLTLQGCRKLAGLPLGMENLSLLQTLDLSGCVSLEELPCNIGRLVALRLLSLNGCSNLKTLGATFRSLPSLVTLDLDYCSKLEAKWMEVFTEMTSLRVVYISECPLLIQRWQQLQQRSDLNIKLLKCIYQEEEENDNDNDDDNHDNVKREEEDE